MKMFISVFWAHDATDAIAGKLEAYPTWRKLPACDFGIAYNFHRQRNRIVIRHWSLDSSEHSYVPYLNPNSVNTRLLLAN